MLNQYTATITTDADGDAEVCLGSCIRGRIVAIKYAPGTLDADADLTITGAISEQPILSVSHVGTSTVWFYPMAWAHNVEDLWDYEGPSSVTEVPLWLYKEALKVVVAEGGDKTTGTITLWVDEPVMG